MTMDKSEGEGARAAQALRKGTAEITENPSMVASSIGTVILSMIRKGDPIGEEALIGELEAVANGNAHDSGLSRESAKGALNFISRLRA